MVILSCNCIRNAMVAERNLLTKDYNIFYNRINYKEY